MRYSRLRTPDLEKARELLFRTHYDHKTGLTEGKNFFIIFTRELYHSTHKLMLAIYRTEDALITRNRFPSKTICDMIWLWRRWELVLEFRLPNQDYSSFLRMSFTVVKFKLMLLIVTE